MTGAREGALPAVDTLGGTIRLTEYRPNYLKYEYASAAPATAVFSEIFYDKGWTAWVDGVETPYFRADYLLRAWNFRPAIIRSSGGSVLRTGERSRG